MRHHRHPWLRVLIAVIIKITVFRPSLVSS
jgi:hypothetical protein